jgi:hypothetical protein
MQALSVTLNAPDLIFGARVRARAGARFFLIRFFEEKIGHAHGHEEEEREV